MSETPRVYAAIVAVQGALAKDGISKNRKNAQQGYNFRGIDDVYNAIAPYLSEHKLCILPRVLNHAVVERTTKNGGILFYTTLDMEFDFVSSEDGSKHVVRVVGEAMDSADKSSNKAMSAAYKYACMQAFCIPTEGDNDADATTHEVKAIERLSEKQVAEIQTFATSLGVDTLKFFKVLNKKFGGSAVKAYSDIPASEYDTVMGLLKQKQAQQATGDVPQ